MQVVQYYVVNLLINLRLGDDFHKRGDGSPLNKSILTLAFEAALSQVLSSLITDSLVTVVVFRIESVALYTEKILVIRSLKIEGL